VEPTRVLLGIIGSDRQSHRVMVDAKTKAYSMLKCHLYREPNAISTQKLRKTITTYYQYLPYIYTVQTNIIPMCFLIESAAVTFIIPLTDVNLSKFFFN